MNLKSARDGTFNVVPGDVDYALTGICKLSEGILEEVKMVLSTAWTLIDDLLSVSMDRHWCSRDINTMAVIELPFGPVTDTHPPHASLSAQLLSDKAVPYIPLGMV